MSRQKKNYENSSISPCKHIVFKKSSKRNQNPSRYYNSITNLKFQHKPKKSSFKNSYIKNRPIITQGPKSLKLLYSIMNLNTTTKTLYNRDTIKTGNYYRSQYRTGLVIQGIFLQLGYIYIIYIWIIRGFKFQYQKLKKNQTCL